MKVPVTGGAGFTRTIVIFSAIPWQGIVARPHHLAREFAARGNRVLFVEPPITWLSPLKKPALARHLHFGKVRRLGAQLGCLTPPPFVPGGYRWRALNQVNQWCLAQSVGAALRHLEWPPGIILTHLPGTADYPGRAPIVYDCVDDHAAFSEYSSLWKKDLVIELEKMLTVRAGAVLATSRVLWERCRLLRADTLLVGNGVDMRHFAPAAAGKTGATGVRGRVAGFYGGIGPWVNLELIARAAALAPTWVFYVAGPLESGLRVPSLPPNVLMPGFVDYNDLPAILADFDVALIPFKNNELTLSVNPLKLYEYFAAGKPVLVTDIPELTRWGPLVYPVISPEKFVEALEQVASENTDLGLRRRRVAEENSWSAKVDAIMACMEGLGL
ncbi:MAG: putative teichuronic acid biosynthesis glycosyltransferase TuaH [Firmicutes bacterium]|nr:putative teichuronic acid biosynthesis glycosyltransferase TuaH [Bacillota bacterium]